MARIARRHRDTIVLKHFLRSSAEVTEEDVAYFRRHPDEIDEITAPVSIHKIFLWGGTVLGVAIAGSSEILSNSTLLLPLGARLAEFITVIVFEIGIALIGGAVTAYLLGVLLNKQQQNASEWRVEIRRRIEESGGSD